MVVFTKRSSKPVMKDSRVETLENAKEEYNKLLAEGWEKSSIFKSYFLSLTFVTIEAHWSTSHRGQEPRQKGTK